MLAPSPLISAAALNVLVPLIGTWVVVRALLPLSWTTLAALELIVHPEPRMVIVSMSMTPRSLVLVLLAALAGKTKSSPSVGAAPSSQLPGSDQRLLTDPSQVAVSSTRRSRALTRGRLA